MATKSKNYWVGEFVGGEAIVFAPELQKQTEFEWVYLWGYASGKVDRYHSAIARKSIRKIKDDELSKAILSAFMDSSFAKNGKFLTGLHRNKIELLGLKYLGVSKSSNGPHRATHCWVCHSHLDNAVDLECNICKWILCTCGACGCGRRIVKV